jgi:hypothetical protein
MISTRLRSESICMRLERRHQPRRQSARGANRTSVRYRTDCTPLKPVEVTRRKALAALFVAAFPTVAVAQNPPSRGAKVTNNVRPLIAVNSKMNGMTRDRRRLARSAGPRTPGNLNHENRHARLFCVRLGRPLDNRKDAHSRFRSHRMIGAFRDLNMAGKLLTLLSVRSCAGQSAGRLRGAVLTIPFRSGGP